MYFNVKTGTDPLPQLEKKKKEIKQYLHVHVLLTKAIFKPICLDKQHKTQPTTSKVSVSERVRVSVWRWGWGLRRILKYFEQLLISFSFFTLSQKVDEPDSIGKDTNFQYVTFATVIVQVKGRLTEKLELQTCLQNPMIGY